MKRLFFVIILIGFGFVSFAQKTPESLGWKLCVGSYTFRLFTFEEALQKADSLGLKYIEMATTQKIGGGIEGSISYTMDKATQKAVLNMVKEHGIKILSYGVVTPKEDSEWEKVFVFAKNMGIKTILTEPPKEKLDMVENLANKYKINVAIHNHPKPTPYWSPEIVLEALNGRSKRLGACADTGHWLRSGLDPVECVKQLEGKIIEFHFKDLNVKAPKGAHDVVWGTGIANVKGIMQEMKRQNYKGAITIEYEYNWKNSVPEIRESLKNFRSITQEL